MDKEHKLKYKREVERRIEKLWDDFLAGMRELGYDPIGHQQDLEFHKSDVSKHLMHGRVTLKVPTQQKNAKL